MKLPGLGSMDLGLPIDPIWYGFVDPAGAATFPIRIPNIPQLKGQRVHTQALISGNSAIFSNVWTLDIQ